jgi:predicted Zn-dependent protease with MMP-like domain
MPHPKLLRLAETEVQRVLAQLPAPVREAAKECLVTYEDEQDDLLGLFEGCSRLDGMPSSPEDMPHISLFLEAIWDEVDADEKDFRKEVRITFLHELGHYLGWGEEEVAALGLA